MEDMVMEDVVMEDVMDMVIAIYIPLIPLFRIYYHLILYHITHLLL
jgi:hypothetical protein